MYRTSIMESPGSSGYLIVDANGGLNQQRSAHWICSYQILFTKVCKPLLAMDRQSTLILPPVHRPYRTLSVSKQSLTQSISSTLVLLF
ncbi:hypothetical protein V6Z12_A09G082700 [Gossypium hirsutum]